MAERRPLVNVGGRRKELPAGDVLLADAAVISANSADPILRITQAGAGNALVVEDSANPDSTPFVIDSGGLILGGLASAQDSSKLQITGASQTIFTNTANQYSYLLNFKKSRSATPGTYATVNSGDQTGAIAFFGDDGTAFVQSAGIYSYVDGAPSEGSMPGRLVFSTTASGTSSPTERMRISNDGAVGIGTTTLTGYSLHIGKSITGATSAYGLRLTGQIQSDVTSAVHGFSSGISASATVALTTLRHFQANQGTFTAGSSITNQYGFEATSALIGATNNYGFYSNIAAGIGRWNFYAAGTADNYFGGSTVLNVNSTSDALRITQAGSGNALVVEDSANPDSTPFVIDSNGKAIIGHTATVTHNVVGANFTGILLQIHGADGNSSAQAITSWSATFPSNLVLSRSKSGAIGTHTAATDSTTLGQISFTGSDGTGFIPAAAIKSEVDSTPGTNDMPGRLVFSTTADGASTPTERMRIDSAGNIGIGTAAPTQILSFGGNAARTIWMERHTTANTAGNSLSFQAGGATVAATNKAGGDLVLAPGVSTGTGESGVQIKGCPAGSSGTADGTPATLFQVLGNKIGLFGVTPVVRPTALTAQLTTLTFTTPGTPDYAIADFTQTTPWGFASRDEARTVMSVIANLQTRVSELETKLRALGALT